jgi:hypothetical protein
VSTSITSFAVFVGSGVGEPLTLDALVLPELNFGGKLATLFREPRHRLERI